MSSFLKRKRILLQKMIFFLYWKKEKLLMEVYIYSGIDPVDPVLLDLLTITHFQNKKIIDL